MLTERDLPWLAEPLRQLTQHARSHALLVQAGRGCGLFELALRVAQTWLCERGGATPCDQCTACHLVGAGSHPDLRVLLPDALRAGLQWQGGDADADSEATAEPAGSGGKRKLSSEIKVAAIRQAIDWAHTSSGRGHGKVMLIHPADAMNEVAANALLKTLEEPAPGVRLLLCCADPERLLPTIRSRCQHVRIPAPGPEQSLAWLDHQGLAHAEVLLHAAGGEPLAARELAAAGVTAEIWAQLPAQVAAGDARGLALLPQHQAIQALLRLCHDLMAVNAGGHARYFPSATLPRGLGWGMLKAWSESLTRVMRHADHPWSAHLLLESLVTQGQQVMAERSHSHPGRSQHRALR